MAALGLTPEPESQGLLCSSSCCISILGRPHPTRFQAPWQPVSSCCTHPLGHTSWLGNPAHADPIYSPPQVPGLLSPESHGVQHLQADHTSSSDRPFPSPPHQGAVRVTGGRACCFDNVQRASTARKQPLHFPLKSRLSGLLCASKITPLSNFNLSTHHSSLEQKKPEIAASREAQPPGAGGEETQSSLTWLLQ